MSNLKDSKIDKYNLINSNVLKEQLVGFFDFQKSCWEKLIEIQVNLEELEDDKKEDYLVFPQGHLVKMTCGHRGIPRRTEEKRVSRLLRKSGFIPMLENVNLKRPASPKTPKNNKLEERQKGSVNEAAKKTTEEQITEKKA